mmetsp:Transcript_1446/g.2907  ORF Transcript_1446/g.2907 Transcript_1446/m.2907 type:complete len:247 (-) Transcript_1446:109-849(-)
MAAVHLPGVVKLGDTLLGVLVTRVDDPTVCLHEHGGSKVLLAVPPVRRARRGAARAQNALIHAIDEQALLLGLGVLLALGVCGANEPGLDRFVLCVEVGHVHDQVLHHIHVRQGSDGDLGRVLVHLAEAGKGVASVDVHSAGAADTLAAGATQREGGVHLVLHLQQNVKHHGPAVVHVHIVNLHAGLATLLLGVPPVDGHGHHLRGLGHGRGRGAHHRGGVEHAEGLAPRHTRLRGHNCVGGTHRI